MQSGKDIGSETRVRSITKGLAWRVLASLTTVIIVLIFTRKPVIAFEVGGVEVVAKFLLYYGHERAWNSIKWGRLSKSTEQA